VSAPRPSLGPIEGITLFSTPICSVEIPDAAAVNAALAKAILAQAGDISAAAVPAWASPWGFPDLGAGVGLAVARAVRLLASRLVADRAPESWRLDGYAEVLWEGAGASVSEPTADFAAIYTVSDGDAGKDPELGGLLEFQDPRGPAPVMYAPALTFAGPGAESLGVTQTVRLQPGLLIVYPAYLMQGLSFYRGRAPHITVRMTIE
jgi:hypothetical protein